MTINSKLSKTSQTNRTTVYVGDNHTMPLEEADKKVSETTESDVQALRLRQAQIMLNLFQEDCGRPATALEEVKQWASAQDNDLLQHRVDESLCDRT
jgi:hypothetical protein